MRWWRLIWRRRLHEEDRRLKEKMDGMDLMDGMDGEKKAGG
jgi:hypothetical protein